MMRSKELVRELCIKNNWDFSLFEAYVNLIEEKNKVMNLTGFSDERLWNEGIYESLVFMIEITKDLQSGTILDIGAGAGFPSIPYVLSKPKNKVVIYEPLLKRVNFLNEVIEKLNLSDYVTVYKYRAEDVKETNQYDVVTARAVATVKALSMAALHLVKVNGSLSLLKGKKAIEELNDAKSVLKDVKVQYSIRPFIDENIDRENYIVSIKKLENTPKRFPYLWKDIKKVN
ncbi:16S rRNA (guanine(527)-N(7))-methyltransferase RsmG [Mycoplasma sp. 2248]|uniref:16S rRNA (guanine(527)-N(7))-methyltransferase RsmG n=1 Tax=Mycoplasma sp. 2248 TaxID=3108528 RepID=UPI002B1DE7D0|nr:16S rRNA (guanine(527)-N(7))-methyltransferase RsmG [Mycoplasma sp. 2248]MEA4190981.1 16S rRNA (guanine(527)-N(7))-methyltransferase RsmG [Mycoplasma sp. 2248]